MGSENVDVLFDLDGSNNLTTRRVHGAGFDELVGRQDAAGTVGWYGSDRLGSVRQVFDNSGNPIGTIGYSAYGQVQSLSGAIDRYQYTGRERDTTAGLIYYRARVATDDGSGRFLTTDPIGFAAGDPNLYRAVGNSPTNATDPSGLQPPQIIPPPPGTPMLNAPQVQELPPEQRIVDGQGRAKEDFVAFFNRIRGMSNTEMMFELIDKNEQLKKELKDKLNDELHQSFYESLTNYTKYLGGLMEGFVKDGFVGSVVGVFDLIKGGFDLIVRFGKVGIEAAAAAWMEAVITRKPPDLPKHLTIALMREFINEFQMVGKAIDMMVELHSGINDAQRQFLAEIKNLFELLKSGGTIDFSTLRPETQRAILMTGLILNQLAGELKDLTPHDCGRVAGFILYQVVESIVLDALTAGVAEAARPLRITKQLEGLLKSLNPNIIDKLEGLLAAMADLRKSQKNWIGRMDSGGGGLRGSMGGRGMFGQSGASLGDARIGSGYVEMGISGKGAPRQAKGMGGGVAPTTGGAKTGPKPKGTGPHNLTITRRIDELKTQLGPDWEHVGGGSLTEHYIRTPGSPTHQARRPDISFRNKKTGEYYHENVGKTEVSGDPIKRERQALEDLMDELGKKPGFTPYDK